MSPTTGGAVGARRPLRAPGRATALSLRIPLRFLRGSYARFALTVGALACGVALVCAFDLVRHAALRAFVEIVDTMAGRAALQVTAGEGGFLPEEAAETVAAVSGVELAVPVVTSTAFVAGGSGEVLTVHGIDVGHEAGVRIYDVRDRGGLEVEDPLLFLTQRDSVLLTRAFAARHGVGVESPIVLDTPSGRRTFTVRGLLEPRGVARVYGGNLVVMDLFAAEAVFTRPGFVNRIDVVVRREADVASVQQAIARVLPAGLEVEPPAQRKADIHRVMQSLHVMLRAGALLGLLAAFLIAFNRLASVFERRVWQVGVLRSVGARMSVVWWELVKESLLLGALGVAAGIPLGIGLGRLLLPVIVATSALNYKLVAPEAALGVRAGSLALAAALGLGAAFLAAAFPAWRASRVTPAETVRERGREQAAAATQTGLLLRVLLVAGIVLAVVVQRVTESAAWGVVATGLIALGAALAARPLVALTSAPLGAALAAAAGVSGRFGAAAISRNPRRASLTIAMLGVGLGCLLWFWTLAHSFEASVLDALGRAFSADLIVTSPRVASGFDGAPFDGKIGARLARTPGIAGVVGERIVDWQYAGGPIALDAFDPAYFRDRRFGQWRLLGARAADVWDAVARGEAVVVSTSFVRNLGARVGDTIALETPSGPVRLRIAGVTIAFASPRGTIEMSRALYEHLWHDRQVTRVHLALAPEADVGAVRAALARQVGPRHGLQILSSGDLLEFWATQVRRAFGFLYLLGLVVLFVVFVGMADTLAAGVFERSREFAAVRAVGARQEFVAGVVVLEGLLLGALGIVLAVAVGGVLGVLWVYWTFPYLLGWLLEFHLPYTPAAVVGGVTMLVCLLAALLSARQAVRLEPGVALRYE